MRRYDTRQTRGGFTRRDNNMDESFKRAVWVFEGSRNCQIVRVRVRAGGGEARGTLGKVASISGSESGLE